MGSLMQSADKNYSGSAWIGLYDDTVNSWRWSLENDSFYGAGERDYRQWFATPDNYGGHELCVVMVFDNKWHDAPCNYTFPVICYDGRKNSNETYVFVPQFMNWSTGQQYCRNFHTDLVSIRNEVEYQNIIQLLGSVIAWLGLYRTRTWSDQSNSTFRYWKKGEPDNGYRTAEEGAQHCTAVAFNSSGRWTDENCTRELPFICYGGEIDRQTDRQPNCALPLYTICMYLTFPNFALLTALLFEGHVIGLTGTLHSERELSQSDIELLIIQQFGEKFRRLGLSTNITLRYVQRIHP
ncbi:hypothetical protein ACEWY4_025139 [Coilia grayii]|uniref:C-type lectin domain-containing protein n=1 Tax=Coilia grayii TaxID=363190 RepID=A0ABD1IZB8_9TELE